MPIYRVQAPNGKIYKVEGPENADPNTLFGFVQNQLEGERFEEMRRGEYGPGMLETLTSGVSRGAKRLGSTFGDVLPAMGASALGFDEYAKQQMEEAAQTEREIQATNRPLFTSYKQVEGPMQALKYGIETVGEQVPNIATSLVPGLGAAGIATRAGLGVAGRAATVGAGSFLGSYAQNAPEVFQNIYDATGKMEPGAAALFSIASAALDSILPASLAGKIAGPAKIGLVEKVLEKSGMDRGLLRSVTAGIATGTPMEGLTEGAQEAISIAAEKFIGNNPQIFGSKEWDRIMESAVRGAVAGGTFGAAGGGADAARAGAERKEAYAQALEKRGARQLAAEVRNSSASIEEILAQNPQMELPGFELGAASALVPPAPKELEAGKELKGRQAEMFTPEGELTPGVAKQAARDGKAAANQARQQAQREAAEVKAAQAKLKKFLAAKQGTLPGFDEASIKALQEQTATQQQATEQAGQGDLFGGMPAAPAAPTAPAAVAPLTPTEPTVATEEIAPVAAPVAEPVVRTAAEPITPATAPAVIDDLKAFGKMFGIGPTARILRVDGPLAGKDISNPADAAEVKRILEAYASGKPAAGAAEKIDAYLQRPEFQGATDVAGPVEPTVGAGVSAPSEPAAGVAPEAAGPVEPDGVVPATAAPEQFVGGEGQQPGALTELAPEELAAADIAAFEAAEAAQAEPAPEPELGKRAQKDIAKAEVGAAKSVEEQAKFIEQVDKDVNAMLVSRMRDIGRSMDVPDDELPAMDYRGTEYHSVLRIAPLLTEYRDIQETLRKYEEGTPQEAKNRQQLSQIEQTIADSNPDAFQFFQKLRGLDLKPQEQLLSLMNREALKAFDADATLVVQKVKDEIAKQKQEGGAAKKATAVAPAPVEPVDPEIEADTDAFNEALFEQTGVTLYETPEQTRAKEENQRAVDERVNREVERLPEKQKQALEEEYQASRDSKQFLRRLKQDVVALAVYGANAVAKGIRAAVKKIAEGVLGVAVLFNPNAVLPNFSFDLPKAYSQTVTQTVQIKDQVPAEAVAKMSPLAKLVYENMAPTAKKSGKGFIIADKPNGMIHFFLPNGRVLVQDAALYGKDPGDVLGSLDSLLGGPKITPAGKFNLSVVSDAEYAGGKILKLNETVTKVGPGQTTFVAVHPAYLGNPAEKRVERLQKLRAGLGDPSTSKISYGCAQTLHDSFLSKVTPNIDLFNGGMLFVLPDAKEKTASMFPATTYGTQTQTFTGFEKNAKAPGGEQRDQLGVLKQDKRKPARGRAPDWRERNDPQTTAPELVKREDGRVLDLVVDGEVVESFELVSPGLWNAFKSEDARQNLLRNQDARTVAEQAYDALQFAKFRFKERGPLNRAERLALEAIDTKNVNDLELLVRNEEIRGSIMRLVSRAIHMSNVPLTESDFVDVDPVAAANLRKYAPDWMLGKGQPKPITATTARETQRPAARPPGPRKPLFLPAYQGPAFNAADAALARSGDLNGLTRSMMDQTNNPTIKHIMRKIRSLNLKTKIVVGNPEGPMALPAKLQTVEDVMNDGVERLVASARKHRLNRLEERYDVGLARADAALTKITEGIENRLRDLGVSNGQELDDIIQDKVLPAVRSRLKSNEKMYAESKAGSYDPATDTITLDPTNGLNAHTFIHELVHAAISNVLASPNHPLTKDFSKFFVQIQDRLGAAYGAQDLQEFAAELVGNPSFQAVLKDIKTPRSESMFRRVLRSIAEFFGFGNKTAFDTGLDFIEKALDITSGVEATPAQKMFLTMGNFSAVGDIGRAMPAMTQQAAETVRNVFSNLNEGGGFKAAAMGVLRLDNLRDSYGAQLPSIQSLLDALEKRTGMQERRIKDANEKYLKFVRVQRKNPAAMKRLNDIAIDARLAEVDLLNPRFQPTAENLAEYNRLSQAFRSLPEDVQGVYRTIRGDYDASFRQYRKILSDAAEQASPSLARRLAEQFEAQKPVVGYIPFLRQGNFWVEYTDPATGDPAVTSFESVRERQQFIDQMLKGRDHRTYQNIQDAQFSGEKLPPTHFIMQVMNRLRGQGATQAQLDGVYQAYLAMFPAESLVKQFMKSKNRLGMERDIVRGYGDLMVRWARKLSNSEYIPQIDRSVRQIQSEAQASGDPTLTSVAQNITDQSAFFHNPNFNTFVHTATAASYFMYIAGNISSALINITSLPMLVYPMLTGRFGWGDTAAAMTEAGRTAMSDFGRAWGKTAKYKRLYETLMDHAQLEHTMAREVMEGRRQTTNDFVGLKARILDGLSIPFSATEKYNRAVTAIAAYDLARKTMNEDQAIRYALNTVKDVHTSGMAATGPKWMQTPMGRLFFTFKSFVWNSAYIMARAFHQAFKGEDPLVRKAAQRQLLATYGMATVFTGIKGMPFYGAISVLANMLNALFGDDDEPFDFDEFMRDIFGEFLFKGAFNYATNIELANRAGIATDLIFRDDPRGVAENGYVLSAMQQAFGPIGSIAVNTGRAAELFQQGEIERGIETITPSFVRNGMKGMRYLLEGATTIKGDPVMEDISAYNSLMQMIGFAPADLSSQYERVQAAKGFEREVNQKRTQLMHKYDMARTSGDQDLMSEVMDDIQKFNETRPSKRITKDSLDRSHRARLAAEKDMIAGVRFDKKLRPEIEEKFFDPYEED